MGQLCVSKGCPSSVYKGGRRRRPILLLVGVHQEGKEEGKREKERGVLRPPNPLSNSDQQGEGRSSPCGLLLYFPYGPIRPITSPGGSEPLRHSGKYSDHLEPFRYPNTTFQYIDLYLSDIPRLLVMSVISSGTPNYLRSLIT